MPDAELYLFGSLAKGTWIEESDVDLMVVSDSFEGKDYLERVFELKKLLYNEGIYRFHILTPHAR